MKESTAKPKFDLIMELNQPTLPTNNTQKKKSLSLSTTKIAIKMNKKKSSPTFPTDEETSIC